MPAAAMQRYQVAIPHAKTVISDSGSHDWIIDQPERFIAAVFEHFPTFRVL